MRVRKLTGAVAILCCLVVARVEGDKRNLQVLPLHLSRLEVLEVMRVMTAGLGAQCTLCHPSERNDYLSDELAAKQVARSMLHMVEADTRGLDWTDPPENLCFRCHEGSVAIPAPNGRGNR